MRLYQNGAFPSMDLHLLRNGSRPDTTPTLAFVAAATIVPRPAVAVTKRARPSVPYSIASVPFIIKLVALTAVDVRLFIHCKLAIDCYDMRSFNLLSGVLFENRCL